MFSLTLTNAIILFIAAVLGGTLNAVAGGGSLIGFPSLIFTGVPSIQANATNTVALWPGSVASGVAYRKELATLRRGLMWLLSGTSLVGGVFGALLLLHTPQSLFNHLIPFLLLIATVLFAFSGQITARLRMLSIEKMRLTWPVLVIISFVQLIISTYGGYFGGGMGLLILSVLAMLGMKDIHAMNGLKTVLTVAVNGVAVITFIIAGAIVWPQAILMIIGAIVGGYGGAYYARKVDQRWIRVFVIVVGVCLTVYFFIRYYWLSK
jgi:uncharacterized membrane protein YfcA